MIETFYNQQEQAVFGSPIEYEYVDAEPERPKVSVDFAPFLRSTAAALGATAVIFCSGLAFSTPSTLDPRVFVTQRQPFPIVAVPHVHQRTAERARQLFRAVPLSASEKIADPDHGL